MSTKTIRLADALQLVQLELDTGAARPTATQRVHRIMVLDVSYSMSGDLESMRRHLKNHLALSVGEYDTLSMLWFSGRGQYGVITEGARVHDAVELAAVQAAIDRYLKPVGMTAFSGPLEEVARILPRLRRIDPDAAISLVFMSDGDDNQSHVEDIMAAATALGEEISSGAVVEYGWYANRPLLARMGEALGVPTMFSEDFARFAPLLDAELARKVDGVRKREVTLPAQPLHGLCYALRGDAIAGYAVIDGRVRVPEDVERLYLFAEAAPAGAQAVDVDRLVGGDQASPLLAGLYAGLVVLSQRMLGDEVLLVLKALGDVRLIRAFANCFGKQQYSAFGEAAASAARSAEYRLTEGYNPGLVPPDDAYTLLDLLGDLMEGAGNRLHVGHPSFNYQRIGRRTEDAGTRLSADEQAEVAQLSASMATTTSSTELARVQARLAEIVADKPKPLVFEHADREAGVALSNLVLNEDRPNVNVLVKHVGSVAVGANPVGLPDKVETHIWRNYNVIKDGIRNLDVLPVSLDQGTHAMLNGRGLVYAGWTEGRVYELDLAALPIINRRMVNRISARDCFALQYELLKAKAAQRVYSYYAKQYLPNTGSLGLVARYGAEAAAWLAEAGLTDGGFSPKRVLAEVSDVYTGRELRIDIKGLKSLPSVNAVLEKLDKIAQAGAGQATGRGARPALTPGEALLAVHIRECQDFADSEVYGRSANPAALMQTWLADKSEFWVAQTRQLMRRLAAIKFSVVVGQRWFPEFSSLDEGTLTILAEDGTEVTATAKLVDVEVKI